MCPLRLARAQEESNHACGANGRSEATRPCPTWNSHTCEKQQRGQTVSVMLIRDELYQGKARVLKPQVLKGWTEDGAQHARGSATGTGGRARPRRASAVAGAKPRSPPSPVVMQQPETRVAWDAETRDPESHDSPPTFAQSAAGLRGTQALTGSGDPSGGARTVITQSRPDLWGRRSATVRWCTTAKRGK